MKKIMARMFINLNVHVNTPLFTLWSMKFECQQKLYYL